MTHNKITIIGTGPAGLTAAIYAARAGFAPMLFAGLQHGGQLTTTTEIENFPGFAEGIMGPKLMADMTTQAERVGAKIVYDSVTAVNLNKKPFEIRCDKNSFTTDALIIATGATAKTLGLKNEAELMGRGLSTCATCDGFFFRGKRVAVVGGGDSAMEEANYLANLCAEVILIHRRSEFKASKIMLERAQKNPKIKFLVPFELDELISDGKELTEVVLKHSESGKKEKLALDGLFYGIGHKPNSEIFADFLKLDNHGYIQVHDFAKTNIEGVFAAGDIADSVFRQAITAAGMGCQAAMLAARYLESKGH